MVNYKIVLLNSAKKDKEKIKAQRVLKQKTDYLLRILEDNPFRSPPFYEKLVGDFEGMYSRRINKQHRLVYRVLKEERIVMIVSMWTHYE
jgi:Txe/YoeB family toxin of toxin-antitoxin system